MTEEAKRNQKKWDESEKWFKAEFPDHNDSCLYGKIAVKSAYTAGRESRDDYIKKLLLSDIDKSNKISELSRKVYDLQKQNGELTDKLTEAKEIVRELVLEVKSYEEINKYDTCELVQKAEAFLKE